MSCLFTKFFRGENVTKLKSEGTGLGLYLVKLIIEASGGQISFTSKLNQGTTFIVKLPIKGVKAKKGEATIDT